MRSFLFLSFVFGLMPRLLFGQHAVATYRMPIDDRGILISPSEPGERYYESDGRGMREPNIYKVRGYVLPVLRREPLRTKDTGRAIRDAENHLWRTHLAKSKDLKNWEAAGGRNSNAASTTSARRRKGLQGLLERIERMALLRPGHEVLVRLLPGGGRSRPDRGRRRDAGRLLFELSGESRNQRPERNRRRMEANQPRTGEREIGTFLQRH